ncbi:MAG: amino acid adenylation domain-containing protein, partial [Acutalibacteraceae bacterium]|nr:amino acid adenylation domain-containing protein [Acutalibacteraceae bacterium]
MANNEAQMIQDIYALTPLQEGMLYHSIIDNSGNYIIQNYIDLSVELDEKMFNQALELLSARYDVLRTAIIYEKVKIPRQVVFKKSPIEFKTADFSHYSKDDISEVEAKLLQEDWKRGFDLQKDTLIRFTYCKLPNNCHKLLYTIHHIIIDGWCNDIIIGKLMEYYSELCKGTSFEALSKAVAEERAVHSEFKDYVRWLKGQNTEKALNYWKNMLSECDTVSEIVPLNPEIKQCDEPVKEYSRSLSKKTTDILNDFAKKNNVSLNAVLESVCGLLLHINTHNENIVFGKTVSGRNTAIKDVENIMGLFINTIPVVVKCSSELSVAELIKQQYKQSVESSAFDFCSLAEIQGLSNQGRDLIKVLYAFENFTGTLPDEDNDDEHTMNFESIKSATGYDITFTITDQNGCLNFNALYNAVKYDDYEINLILDRIVKICDEISINPNIKISEINFITDVEENKVLSEFNNTVTDYPREKTVAQLLEEQAIATPDKIAVKFENEQLTYKELNEKANALAYKLREAGVKADDFVAILAERCIETIVGICGILKAGGAYVPIDPTYPESRIKFIIEDCSPKVIVNCVEDELSFDTDIPVIKYTDSGVLGSQSDNLDNICTSENLVYCIYTSGTTGNPKGSMIENRSVIRLVKNNNYVKLNSETVILQTGSVSFDASTFEIWGALLNGGTLILASQEVITDREQMKNIFACHNVNTLWLTSTLFNQMISEDKTMFNSLKYLMIGGEKLSDDHVRMLKNNNKNTILINGYGPTENTTFTTTYEIPEKFEVIPIGKPISNTKVYILNNMQLCGIGVPGELCIAGDGVARGYLNRPDLTAEKFIDNPFGDGKLYRSGDLARWLPDGNIEYLGRIDEQVKIRGFRIELGEIESKIREISGIKDSAVIAKADKGGDKAIYAYYTGDKEISVTYIRDILSETLPEYMIPSYMMQIEAIPVTTNGKLNKRALPEIDAKTTKEYIAPRTETEKVICEVFVEILGAEKVGINDSFFELGGHSLRATRLVNSIEAKLGVKIALKDVFSHTTPEQLAKIIDGSTGDEYVPIPRAEEKEYYPMSSAQKRTYLIQQITPDSVTYNIPQNIKLEGEVYPEKLKSALQEMTDRHEILRTAFLTVDGECVQNILPNIEADFEYVSESTKSDEEIYNEFVRPFDLSDAKNVRVMLVNKGEYHLLLIDMHHIVSDGMSMT